MNLYFKKTCILVASVLLYMPAMAQAPLPNTLSNPLAQVLIIIIGLLAVAIAILANAVNGAVSIYREKMLKEKSNSAHLGGSLKVLLVFFLLGIGSSISPSWAQVAAPAAAPVINAAINGLTPFTFYLLVAVIGIEILILLALTFQLKFLVGIESKRRKSLALDTNAPTMMDKLKAFWDRANQSKSIAEEADIDLDHDYDGIRELDNKVPPWWRWVFIFSIVFSLGYLWRYHIGKTAPLQNEEYAMEMKNAELEMEAHLKIAGSKVDENTVAMVDAAGIQAGKALFTQNCVACHGPEGQGGAVGPNLSDNYWIHGGSIHDVFKSIKYGWQEKGMRSWKDDFSPEQMAQLSSFIKSLKGVKLANPKEPQGELFEEAAATAAVPAATN